MVEFFGIRPEADRPTLIYEKKPQYGKLLRNMVRMATLVLHNRRKYISYTVPGNSDLIRDTMIVSAFALTCALIPSSVEHRRRHNFLYEPLSIREIKNK